MIRFLLPLILVCCFCPVGQAQVLSLDKKAEDAKKPIKLSGEIVEQKKYSFSLKSDDTVYEVRVPRGTPIAMKLSRPRFDFVSGKVWVTPPAEKTEEASTDTTNGNSQKKTPDQVAFAIPQPAFLIAEFTHAAQMKRIMNADTIRLNNYTIQPTDPGAKLPSEDEKPILIAGKLATASDPNLAELIVEEKRFKVMLGHRGAKITGFSVATLDAAKVYLTVTGTLDDEGAVTAQSIELFPVVPPESD